MTDKLSDSLHLYFEPDDKMGQRFVRQAKALEQQVERLSAEDALAAFRIMGPGDPEHERVRAALRKYCALAEEKA